MEGRKRVGVLGGVVALLAAATSARAEGVTLAGAIEAALAHAPAARAAAAGIEAADAARDSGRARFLPVLRLEGGVQVWDRPTDISFAGGGGAVPMLPPPSTPYEAVVAALLDSLGGTTRVRDQVTTNATVSIVQPITPFLILNDTHALLDRGVEAAELGREQALREAVIGAVRAWLGTQQADAMAAVAEQSVTELDAQLARVEALVAAGAARESDRLRLRVARAAAEQRLIEARAAVRLSRSALATAMGVPREPAPIPVALGEIACPPEETAVDALVTRALEQRAELRRTSAQAGQAEAAAEVSRNQLWPTLAANASYLWQHGQTLSEENQLFVGLSLAWNAFEWGATSSQVDEAAARARQARASLGLVSDGVRLEVEQAWLAQRTASSAAQVAELARTEAEESRRLEAARYEAGAASATDLVTAETALAEARARHVAASHQCVLAHAALRAAVGDPLTSESVLPR